MNKKKVVLHRLDDYKKDMSYYIEFALSLIQNLELFFKQADSLIKNKLVKSIEPQNLKMDSSTFIVISQS